MSRVGGLRAPSVPLSAVQVSGSGAEEGTKSASPSAYSVITSSASRGRFRSKLMTASKRVQLDALEVSPISASKRLHKLGVDAVAALTTDMERRPEASGANQQGLAGWGSGQEQGQTFRNHIF